MISLQTRIPLAALILLASLNASVYAAEKEDSCTLGCHNGGICRWEEWDCSRSSHCIPFNYMVCECPTGFTGQHCDIPVVTCPDGNSCFYGSTCVENGRRLVSYAGLYAGSAFGCDCSTAPSDIAIAGYMCEHLATESCESGVETSKKSFCTNGGSCMLMIDANDSEDGHHGCECPEEYEGPFCQYLVGQAQYNKGHGLDIDVTSSMTFNHAQPTDILKVVLVVIGAFGLLLGVLLLVELRTGIVRTKHEQSEIVIPAVSAILEPDGGKMGVAADVL